MRIEFSRRQGCIVKEAVRGGEEVKYKIQDEVETGRLFEVRFSSSECLVGCICRMFEFRGILCRHVLFVLSHECVTVLPDRYILDRWRKDIKQKTHLRLHLYR
jgi:zinc finger SWIM domain-containing protein 3